MSVGDYAHYIVGKNAMGRYGRRRLGGRGRRVRGEDHHLIDRSPGAGRQPPARQPPASSRPPAEKYRQKLVFFPRE